MIVADPLGELRAKVKDCEQYIYYDMGFDAGRSPMRGLPRKIYLWESIGLHMIKSLGLAFPSSRK